MKRRIAADKLDELKAAARTGAKGCDARLVLGALGVSWDAPAKAATKEPDVPKAAKKEPDAPPKAAKKEPDLAPSKARAAPSIIAPREGTRGPDVAPCEPSAPRAMSRRELYFNARASILELFGLTGPLGWLLLLVWLVHYVAH